MIGIGVKRKRRLFLLFHRARMQASVRSRPHFCRSEQLGERARLRKLLAIAVFVVVVFVGNSRNLEQDQRWGAMIAIFC